MSTEVHGKLYNETGYAVRFSKDDHDKMMLASAIGTTAGTIPFSVLFDRFKARRMFLVAGCISVVSTVLFPIATTMSYEFAYTVRFVQVRRLYKIRIS